MSGGEGMKELHLRGGERRRRARWQQRGKETTPFRVASQYMAVKHWNYIQVMVWGDLNSRVLERGVFRFPLLPLLNFPPESNRLKRATFGNTGGERLEDVFVCFGMWKDRTVLSDGVWNLDAVWITCPRLRTELRVHFGLEIPFPTVISVPNQHFRFWNFLERVGWQLECSFLIRNFSNLPLLHLFLLLTRSYKWVIQKF